MYLDTIAEAIQKHIPSESMPTGDARELMRMYAVLLQAKGSAVTASDVHDAWSVWMSQRDSNHKSLVPYNELSSEVQKEDGIFVTAIRNASGLLKDRSRSSSTFSEVLFPLGPPQSDTDSQQAMDLYKIMVASSEGLVSRRQGVNTFFLTINGALVTASGLFVQSFGAFRFGCLGVAVLGATGAILCLAWRSLITSFGQLNSGKFKVINTLEQHLRVAIYAAEWEALERGQNPKIYKSFTEGEIWVPNALFILHGVLAFVALSVYFGAITLK